MTSATYPTELPSAPHVADAIARQLGGVGRLRAMIGAECYSFATPGASGLSVRFRARSLNRANWIEVTLERDDTYRVVFWSLSTRRPRRLVSEFREVYAEGLRDLVESETGLALSLCPRLPGRA
jgi:hypothetical protein